MADYGKPEAYHRVPRQSRTANSIVSRLASVI